MAAHDGRSFALLSGAQPQVTDRADDLCDQLALLLGDADLALYVIEDDVSEGDVSER
jgi:hypothetical protein